jgi:Trk K+ transport system NAD-binding subunit
LSEPQEALSPTTASKLENHVIVMGYGLLGLYAVEKLKEMGLSYIVIVSDESRLQDLRKSHIPSLVTPMAKSFQTLKSAGAAKASAVIATFDDDGDNLLSILNAKKINPELRVITVINDRDMVEAAEATGADVVLTPYELTGQLLALSTVSKRTSALFVKGSFKANHISEFVIDGDGKATYHDLNKVAPIVMVSRNGKTTVNPKDQFGLEKGDIVYAMTDTRSLIALEDELFKLRMISIYKGSGERQLARSGKSEGVSPSLNDFVNEILYGPLSIIRHIWIQILLLTFMLGFGTAIFSFYQHLPLLTAFVGSVSTITTIGIYAPNIVGMPDSELVLLAITFIVSVGLAASVVQGILTSVISREALRQRRLSRKIEHLRDHVIVAGYSYLGKYAVESLKEMNVEHVIITVDPALARSLQQSNQLVIQATASRSFQALKEAGVGRASTLICALDDDGDNLLVAMNARKQNNAVRILTVVSDRELVESAKASSDIDVVVPIFSVTANILAFSAVAPEIAGSFVTPPLSPDIKEVSRYLAEFIVGNNSTKLSFKELNVIAPVLLIMRNGKVIPNPDDEFMIQDGDALLVMTPTHDSIEKFRTRLTTSA